MDAMTLWMVLGAAVGLALLAWAVVGRSQARGRKRLRALNDVMDAADALEVRLRQARGEFDAIAGEDAANPAQAAMSDLLRQRLWLRDHGANASLARLAEVRAGIEHATGELDLQLRRIDRARAG